MVFGTGVKRQTARMSGRRAVAERLRRLSAEPWCRICLKNGTRRLATVPDHIVPLAFGGSDEDSNIQCLCDDCHRAKTLQEGAAHGGADNHPAWLRPSAVPLTIVCGPPCAGKTTYVHTHKQAKDTVIDIDSIMAIICPGYVHWQEGESKQFLNRAIRMRNEMLGSLSRQSRYAAWFIVAAPTAQERAWWARKLGGTVVLLHPGVDECKRRAIMRGTPKAIEGIDKWENRATLPWQAKLERGVDVNGIPVSPDHPWNKNRK